MRSCSQAGPLGVQRVPPRQTGQARISKVKPDLADARIAAESAGLISMVEATALAQNGVRGG